MSAPRAGENWVAKSQGIARLLPVIELLERVAGKLPGPLQKAILNEVTPVKDLFLRERPARILIVGQQSAARMVLLEALFGGPLDLPGPAASTWCEFSRDKVAALHVIDARLPASLPQVEAELRAATPDLILYLREDERANERFSEDMMRATDAAVRAGKMTKVIGVALADDLPGDEAVQALHALLHAQPVLSARMVTTLAISARRLPASGTVDAAAGRHIGALAEAIVQALPDEAKVQMARLSRARGAQQQIAQRLVKSITAINSAIGVQPIPLADFPILMGMQALMVAGIMRASGRELRIRESGEFLTAIGANVGVGLVLREGSRAVAKLVPFWGNIVSGAIAGAGTYAMGRAATAYFIEDKTIEQARKVFRLLRRAKKDPTALPPLD